MSDVAPEPEERRPTAGPARDPGILMADRSDQLAPRPAPKAVREAVPKSPRESIVTGEVPPPPAKRVRSRMARSSTLGFMSGLITFVTLILLGLGAAVYMGRSEFEDPGPLKETKVVAIPQRVGLSEISDILAKNGVITYDLVFTWGVRLSGLADRLKPGEYEFKAGISMHEVADLIADGKVVQHSLTFPEGWTSEQIVARLLENTMLTGKIAAVPEEGSLMPDTYKFERGRTRESLIAQMKATQERRLAEIWGKRVDGLPLATPRDMVVLASIVEKETSRADERSRVAAVFINRLRKGMRLETDPTILYGLYGGKAWLEGRTITKADLAAPNAYNTYKNAGLPPGPIGNPGRAALEAVANPSRTNELFFVADGTGGHAFAETIEEHNRNVQRWRLIEAARRGGAAGAEGEPVAQGLGGLPAPAGARPSGLATPTAKPPVVRPAVTPGGGGAAAPRPVTPAAGTPATPRTGGATPGAAARPSGQTGAPPAARPPAGAPPPPPPPPPPPAAE